MGEQHLPREDPWGAQDNKKAHTPSPAVPAQPHLDHTEQQAEADDEEHANEEEAGEQVGCKAGQRLRQSRNGLRGPAFGNC